MISGFLICMTATPKIQNPREWRKVPFKVNGVWAIFAMFVWACLAHMLTTWMFRGENLAGGTTLEVPSL